MLRTHYYHETPKLQTSRSKKGRGQMEGNQEGRKEERRGRKGSERGGTSLPLVPRSNDIPKNENFPKPGIPKQQDSRDCHKEWFTIVLSQKNSPLGLAEYELIWISYAIS